MKFANTQVKRCYRWTKPNLFITHIVKYCFLPLRLQSKCNVHSVVYDTVPHAVWFISSALCRPLSDIVFVVTLTSPNCFLCIQFNKIRRSTSLLNIIITFFN